MTENATETETAPEPEPEKLTCGLCTATSAWKDGFVTEPGILYRSRVVCLSCYGYRQKFLHYYLYWLRWLAMAVGAGFLLTGSITNAAAFALGLYLLTYLTIVVHELGHFAAARLLGVEVPIMSFGGGLRAKVVKLRNTFLLLSPTPTEGLILPLYDSGKHFRKKALLIFAAGPATNVFMALLSFAFLISFEGQYLSDFLGSAIFLWAVINLAVGVGNLVPFTNKTAFGPVPSDGAQILKFRRMHDNEVNEILGHRNIQRAAVEFNYGDMERCLAILEQEVPPDEGSIVYKSLITGALADTGNLDRGVALGRKFLEDDSLGLMEKAILQNNLAFTLFLRGSASDLNEADALSATAYEVLPMILPVKGTRGSVLIGQGRYREGVELLTDKRFRLEPPSHRATVYAIRAGGLAALGELDRAQESLRAAESLESANRHLPSAAAAIRHQLASP